MDILKPIAAPSVGGMITSGLHVLFMTPLLFIIGEDIRRSRLIQSFRQRFRRSL
jgi:Cu(I)/Ag(I) efflux system membrane protein CusA/SilA